MSKISTFQSNLERVEVYPFVQLDVYLMYFEKEK